MASGAILVLNAGSSSIKFAVFDEGLRAILSGAATEIGGAARLRVGPQTRPADLPDQPSALAAILAALESAGIAPGDLAAAGHRVVHGGARLTDPCRVDDRVLDEIAACAPLAPLHNPHNLAAIRALAALAPALPQVASFDTGFHATLPEVARRYALPAAAETRGIRRYGFHGISYRGLVARLPEISQAPLPRRLLALHLGNGASLCAILDGRSVATTMGYSPLEGLTMGTRSGSVDPNAVLDMAAAFGIEETRHMLNRESGLWALGGRSDMRALRAADTPEARFAIAHFAHSTIRHAGAMIAAMGGLDAVAFTGGIGENDARMRAEILGGLAWAGIRPDAQANARGGPALHSPDAPVPAWIVPADEERQIARDTRAIVSGRPGRSERDENMGTV